MGRVYNFSAGPAVLPEEVLEEAAAEMLDYRGHRHVGHGDEPPLCRVRGHHRRRPRPTCASCVGIPDNYRVLFLQGGASQPVRRRADEPHEEPRGGLHRHAASWAKKAFKEAKIYGDARVVASSEDETFSYIPDCSDLDVSPDADYVYICENNTIYGTKFHTLPEHQGQGPGGRRVVVLPVRAGGHHQVRRHVRWRAEEHRPGRRGHLHHPRGPRARRRVGMHAHHAEAGRRRPTRTRSTTRRPPTASTSVARCSSG